MVTKIIDGVSFELKEDFNFDFLSEYGQVFSIRQAGFWLHMLRSSKRK